MRAPAAIEAGEIGSAAAGGMVPALASTEERSPREALLDPPGDRHHGSPHPLPD